MYHQSPASEKRWSGNVSKRSATPQTTTQGCIEPVRAAIRVRPLDEHEKAVNPELSVSVSSANASITVTPPLRSSYAKFSGKDRSLVTGRVSRLGAGNILGGMTSTTLQFFFDYAFWSVGVLDSDGHHSATQSDVFEVVAAPLVNHAFHGFNSCLFAYGQTGSGKTYTMMGALVDEVLNKDAVKTKVVDDHAPISDDEPTAVFYGTPTMGHTPTVISHRRTLSKSGLNQSKDLTGAMHPEGSFFAFDSEFSGITPRLLSRLFGQKAVLEESTRSVWRVQVGYVEVYNEQIFDLLVDEEPSRFSPSKRSHRPSMRPGQGGRKESCWDTQREYALEVREDPSRGVFIQGQNVMVVNDEEEALGLLQEGNSRRTVAATRIHDRSSRSHAIFQITLQESRKLVVGQRVRRATMTPGMNACVNLVDLAGSERVEASGVKGAMMTQTNYINLSLTSLGRVIDALAELANSRAGSATPRIVPAYRESKLTYILRESLGGNSKTMMLATISPSTMSVDETLNTLRYASRARKITMTRSNEDATAKRIRELEEETARLQELLGYNINPNDDVYIAQMSARIRELEMETARKSQDQFAAMLEAERREIERRLRNAHDIERKELETDLDRLKEMNMQLQTEYTELEGQYEVLVEKTKELEQLRVQLEEQTEIVKGLSKLLASGNLQLEVALRELENKQQAKEAAMDELAQKMESLDDLLESQANTEGEKNLLQEQLDLQKAMMNELTRDIEMGEQQRVEMQHLRETLEAMHEDAEESDRGLATISESESKVKIERDRAEDLYEMHCWLTAKLAREAEEAKKSLEETLSKLNTEKENTAELLEKLSEKDDELEALKKELADKDDEATARDAVIAAKDNELEALKRELADKDDELAAKDKELDTKGDELDTKDDELEALQSELNELVDALFAKDDEATARDAVIAAKDNELEARRRQLAESEHRIGALSLELRNLVVAFESFKVA